ncbi:5319_t:CDS:2 [Dentiscutata heterogama]|uniref:5319_t:CDS:1 n=1 Tax=Dentiscutata heterogama TaxID=1316150 RepID=A0ACA9MKE6_9GLOM|nr:5319_t:CDS:2 [Dentiscutata heterogama]
MKAANFTHNEESETSSENQPNINNTAELTFSDEQISYLHLYQITMLETLLVLELLKKATTHLSTSSYPTLGDTQFIFEGIQVCLESFIKDNNFTQSELAESILQKLLEY